MWFRPVFVGSSIPTSSPTSSSLTTSSPTTFFFHGIFSYDVLFNLFSYDFFSFIISFSHVFSTSTLCSPTFLFGPIETQLQLMATVRRRFGL